MDRNNDIILFLLSSSLIIPIIRSAIKSMLKANIGKRNEKKIKKKPTIVDRILLTYTMSYTKKYSRLCKVMVSVNCIYVLVVILFIFLVALSNVRESLWPISNLVFRLKGFILDIPVLIFFFFGTRHSRQGGSEWRFEK